MLDFWFSAHNNPLLLAFFIIIGTYILEDAAIVSAALLSADGLISPFTAFAALIIGILTGDIGLYLLGILLRNIRSIAHFISIEKFKQAQGWLTQRMTLSVLLVRFIPGLRLPTYTACGFLGLPFGYFFMLVLLAGITWTAVIFWSIFIFSHSFLNHLSYWKWLFLPVLLALIVLRHEKLVRYFTQVLNNGR